MRFKKILLMIILILITICVVFAMLGTGKKGKGENNKKHIVVSNFASYDFLRAIIGEDENIELTFLIGPGKDAHSYDPTAKDLITIQNADLFVYVGGEMEKWSERVLKAINIYILKKTN